MLATLLPINTRIFLLVRKRDPPPPRSPANGAISILVPRRLLVFRSHYHAAPAEPLWRDRPTAPGRPARREFSSAFYADLLPALGVAAVLRLAAPSAAAAAAFAGRGLAHEDLGGAGAGGGSPLRALDRLVAVMGACGGAVAVDCGGAGEGGGPAGAVLAAVLARGGMGAREAAAWVRLACGGPAVREV